MLFTPKIDTQWQQVSSVAISLYVCVLFNTVRISNENNNTTWFSHWIGQHASFDSHSAKWKLKSMAVRKNVISAFVYEIMFSTRIIIVQLMKIWNELKFLLKLDPIEDVSVIKHCHLLAVQREIHPKSMPSMTFYIAYWYGKETTAHQRSSPILFA